MLRDLDRFFFCIVTFFKQSYQQAGFCVYLTIASTGTALKKGGLTLKFSPKTILPLDLTKRLAAPDSFGEHIIKLGACERRSVKTTELLKFFC